MATPTFQWTLSSYSDETEFGWDLVDETTGLLVASQEVTTNSFNNSFNYTPTPSDSEPALIGNDVYRWYVYAWNTYNGQVLSRVATQSFTDSEPFGAPTPLAPTALSVAGSIEPEFEWSSVSVSGTAGYPLAGYELNVVDPTGAVNGFPILVTNGTSYSPSPTSPLTNGIAYEWQVNAVFDIGATDVDGPSTR